MSAGPPGSSGLPNSPGLDELLARIRAQMDLDSQAEHEVLAELRGHLEDAYAEARAEGLDEQAALDRVAARFGAVDQVGRALQQTHAGWGTADALIATALPVLGAIVLRWLVFGSAAAPGGRVTALHWTQVISRPAFWIVALAVLLVPVLRFERWRYGLVLWAIFWALTLVIIVH